MSSLTLQQIRSSLPFLIALAVLALIVVTARHALRVGYDGVDFNPVSGLVLDVDPDGPAAGRIQVGDRILRIDGVPIEEAPPVIGEHVAGDLLTYLISQDGQRIELRLGLVDKPPEVVVQYLVAPVVALSFWTIGVAVMAFGQAGREAGLFLAFTLVAGSTLTTGSISSAGPNWAATLFNILVWFAGPVAVQLHLRFPETVRDRRLAKLPTALYSLALVGSLPFALVGAAGVRASPLVSAFFSAERLFLSLCLLLVVLLLLHAYRSASSVMVRTRVRLVTLGGGLGLLLVVVLSLLPGALLRAPLIPYDFSFAALIAIPASYGYAIARHRLLGLERFLSRGAAFTLVFALLAALYLALTTLIQAVLPGDLLNRPLFNMLLILLLAGTAIWLYRRFQAVVDFAFYGGWYDFRTALERITSNLENLADSETLAATLAERVMDTLRLQAACVFIARRDGSLALSPSTACQLPTGEHAPLSLPADGQVLAELNARRAAQRADELLDGLSGLPLTRAERLTLHALSGYLLVPVPGVGGVQGLLALGRRRGGEAFSQEDQAILHQVARHAGVAIETVRLASEVRRQAREVRQLNSRLMRAREQERKSLARQLHDQAIQALIGLNFQLAHLDRGSAQTLRADVASIVDQLRAMIRELRPPALDNFGLVTAVRTEIREQAARSLDGLRIDLLLNGDGEMALPEDVLICVYRVIQEALNNVERHAEARRAEVQLLFAPEHVQVIVQDDGRGFQVPRPLGTFVEQNHFGLVGLRERVQLLGGTLELRSVPGEGTTVHVRLPLQQDGSPS